jgi:cellulose synthase/poly-beta-1,6-N-acetylglucosamine synthase-like glycosyltransferase
VADQRTLCVIIPAYNEELVIASSLAALKKVVPVADIYVVSDGSKDSTAAVARKYTKHVLDLKKNLGKAKAIEALLKEYKLLERYEYVLFSDADSVLGAGFMEEITKFAKDKPACIVGKVSSHRHGMVSAFRTYEYGLSHRVFKQAQSAMQVVTVAPGCASLYRSDVLSQLEFSQRTLTEDFDLTLQIHLKKLGKIIYAPRAVVITQDPETIRDYWKQITRWYTGFWQNLALHKVYKPRKMIFAEIWLMLIDSMFWIFALFIGLLRPLLFLKILGLSYLTVLLLGVIVLTIEGAWWAFPYLPSFPLFQEINLVAYIYSFGRALRGRKHALAWNSVERYLPETK